MGTAEGHGTWGCKSWTVPPKSGWLANMLTVVGIAAIRLKEKDFCFSYPGGWYFRDITIIWAGEKKSIKIKINTLFSLYMPFSPEIIKKAPCLPGIFFIADLMRIKTCFFGGVRGGKGGGGEAPRATI